MKYIPYADHGGVSTQKLVQMIVSQAAAGGIQVPEMRKRVRILDALEAQQDRDGLTIEDADHALLRQLVEAFPFGMASRALLAFVDAVVEAKEPAGRIVGVIETAPTAAA